MKQFDIDLIYLWADGKDPVWLAKKNKFLGKEVNTNTDATTKARTADNEELRFSLRSVEKYAPWVRKIYLVTDEQTPYWLDLKHPKIQLIDIREILPPEALPCYNSVVIEYFFYKTPGLSEHFIYANDDMFINKPLTPNDFFMPDGRPIVRLKRNFAGKYNYLIKKSLGIPQNMYRKTLHNAAKLVEDKYGVYYSGIPHHNIDAYLKSDYEHVVEYEFADSILPTVTNHIRTEHDIQRIIFLYYLLAIKHGKLSYVTRNTSCQIRLNKPNFMRFIKRYNPTFFCLNDGRRASDSDRERIKPFLQQLFPQKSSFEL